LKFYEAKSDSGQVKRGSSDSFWLAVTRGKFPAVIFIDLLILLIAG
jgi:hypothetical protein